MATIRRDRPVVRQRGWQKLVLIGLLYVLPLVGSVVFGGVYYKKYQQLNAMSADQFTQRDNDRMLADIKKVYSLPKDEAPSTIATVKDKEALKKQYAFFDQAENGDVVLIYEKAQLALIYRPATKQVVKSGPLNIQDQLKIGVIGEQAARKSVIKTLGDGKVTATDNGDTKTAATGITVVDLTGKNAAQAKQLADMIKGQVGQLPDGESKPADVDLLVIVGPSPPAL